MNSLLFHIFAIFLFCSLLKTCRSFSSPSGSAHTSASDRPLADTVHCKWFYLLTYLLK